LVVLFLHIISVQNGLSNFHVFDEVHYEMAAFIHLEKVHEMVEEDEQVDCWILFSLDHTPEVVVAIDEEVHKDIEDDVIVPNDLVQEVYDRHWDSLQSCEHLSKYEDS
jgi:hypothetical protein